jgi:hypothetical protein
MSFLTVVFNVRFMNDPDVEVPPLVPDACVSLNTAIVIPAPDALAVNTDALAEMKVRDPPAFCTNARVPEVATVQVPAVTVQTPAPIFSISTTSDAPKIDVFTVIVVAEAEFITTLVPRSATVNV